MTKQEADVKLAPNGDGLPKKKRRASVYKVTGSPQAKRGKWYAVLAYPVPGQAKKKTRWIPLNLPEKGHKKEAREQTARLVLEENAKDVAYTEDILFADWLDRWLTYKKRSGLSDVTIQGYRSYIKTAIGPFYRERGTILQRMRRADVQCFYDAQVDKGLSGKSIKNYAAVIHGALQYAYNEEIIPNNPADRAELPRAEKPKHTVYTLEQLNRLLEVTKDEEVYPAIFLAAYFGLRRSEVAGLEWKAVDLNAKTLTVCKTVSKFSYEVIKEGTKTDNSLRTLPIPDALISFFRKLYAKQAAERLAAGPDYVAGDWVCRFSNGNRFHPDYITRAFNRALKKAGLPHITFHELRHTFASLLIEQHSDLKRVSEILGHADMFTTADLYCHLSAQAKRETLDNFCKTLEAV